MNGRPLWPILKLRLATGVWSKSSANCVPIRKVFGLNRLANFYNSHRIFFLYFAMFWICFSLPCIYCCSIVIFADDIYQRAQKFHAYRDVGFEHFEWLGKLNSHSNCQSECSIQEWHKNLFIGLGKSHVLWGIISCWRNDTNNVGAFNICWIFLSRQSSAVTEKQTMHMSSQS